uniref:(California timema) hypothetical protein n=1 Tax=Timema californicum TaxID=61474 RepID=A0A7R9J3F2_TIMCA|nr:unnamed protein product [Timema californicum]
MVSSDWVCHSTLNTVLDSTIRAACSAYRDLRDLGSLKRFYRKTNALYSDGKYEITLDQRKLKTPHGNLFVVESEPLALAVAAEWDAQKTHIKQSSMHLSALCSTAIDNPNHLNKFDLVNHILSFLDTDTVLFHSYEETELCKLQAQEWQPILDWFCERYNVQIESSREITGPHISQETKSVLRKHLQSYSLWAVHGFSFAVETVKSLILTLCCVDRHISVEKAVLLSRLEEEFQATGVVSNGPMSSVSKIYKQDFLPLFSSSISPLHQHLSNQNNS